MDKLRKPPADPEMKSYNHSISIIQSSGMGKSRLVDAVAKIKFCFPFNLREPLVPGNYGSVDFLMSKFHGLISLISVSTL
jgi:hypothetical protein